MYRDLFGANNELREFVPNRRIKERRRFSGEYEKLLCQDCEKKIKFFEDYAIAAIYGGDRKNDPKCKNYKIPEGLVYTKCSNIDYVKFKLFLLSLIWRMSVSTREFFKSVHLGPHEETIRRMILKNNPGNFDKYPSVMINIGSVNKLTKGILQAPVRQRNKAHIYYNLTIGGIIYLFYISDKAIPQKILDLVLKPNNELIVPHSTGILVDNLIKNLSRNVG